MTAATSQNPPTESNTSPSLGQRLQKWRGWVAPTAVAVVLLMGICSSSWISASISTTTEETGNDQFGLVQQTANLRFEALRMAGCVGRLSDLPWSDNPETNAQKIKAWQEGCEAAFAAHHQFEASLESLSRRFETPKDWEEVEGCRERTILILRSADLATLQFATLQRVAAEHRATEVAGTVESLTDIYRNIDGQLESLASVGTQAAAENLDGLRLAGQTLVAVWLVTSIAVVVTCGGIVFFRVRAEHIGEAKEIVLLGQKGNPDADLTGCRVLLAEDGESNQRLMASILTRSGAAVEVASDGKAALDLFFASQRQETPFDVLLLDLQMPNLDGLAALMKIRSTGFTGGAIALATPSEADSRRACIHAGFNDMLQKPASRDDLIAAVDRVRTPQSEPQPV